jgi:hypothetical protein
MDMGCMLLVEFWEQCCGVDLESGMNNATMSILYLKYRILKTHPTSLCLDRNKYVI